MRPVLGNAAAGVGAMNNLVLWRCGKSEGTKQMSGWGAEVSYNDEMLGWVVNALEKDGHYGVGEGGSLECMAYLCWC
jgi:hypothetical protein